MPPKTGGKPVKNGGSLHTFFGPTTSQPKSAGKLSQPSASGSQKAKSQSSKREVTIIDESDDEAPIPKKNTPVSTQTKAKKPIAIVSSDDDEPVVKASPKKKETTLKRKNRAVLSSDEDEDEEDTPPPKKKSAVASSSSKPKPRPSTSSVKSKGKKKAADEDYDMESLSEADDDDDNFVVDDDDEDEKPKKKKVVMKKAVKAEKEKAPAKSEKKAKDEEVKKEDKPAAKSFNWAAKKAAQLAGPVAHGSKAVPDGAPDALAGLSLVFTGELSSFSREEAIDLGKRFGARVVMQPSSKTDYVVLGDNAGPSKIAAIKKHGIKTLDEDEFLALIGTRKGLGNGKVDEKTKKKMEKEEEEIRKAAREMEKREAQQEREREKAAAAREKGKGKGKGDVGAEGSGGGMKVYDPATQLWTVRYAPQNLKEICGNKGQVEKLQQWLHDWDTSVKAGFKKPGKTGMNMFRAVLITGPPGIGKTTSAHLCAKLEGFTPIELNASDARSKKLVENGMNINNTSLDGFIHGAHETNSLGVMITNKTCLIMDEVDGMSAGDRGGVGALNAMIKKTKIPIICIANDRGAQKLKPLSGTTFSLPFSRPTAQSVRSRILTIAFKEKMKIPANVIDQLVTGAQSDIRQVLNMLSTWKLSSDAMDFDEGKDLAKMNQKHSIMSPFDITSKLLGPYVYSATSRDTLGDKMEYYFQDHSFMPLFVQENYLKTTPARSRNQDGPEKVLKDLRLMEKAASSISDGDLVDALIHGPEQHWSLMPLHAVCSTVIPTYNMYGGGMSYGGANAISFPQWLGQNSKQNKLARQLGDVQIRMRLKVSGDKTEIRQSYIPAMFPHIVQPLMDTGASAVDEVIEHMDEYFISREDWDTIVELGVDDKKDEGVLKKISTATKTAFTRKYNTSDHPIPFHKAQDLGKAPKKLAGGPAPDLEEAYIDDVEVSDDDSKPKEDADDISKDSLIKVPKKRKAPAAKPKAKK